MVEENIRFRNRPLEPQKKAIVIGASSGIGAALTRRLAWQGYSVAALARREVELNLLADSINGELPDKSEQKVMVFSHNVANTGDVTQLFGDIVYKLGGLDLIVYVAGIQPPVELDEYNYEKDEATIQVNLLGAIAWLNQAARRFERLKGGHIVGISSIAGDRGRVGSPVYNTSKAALNTYLEALRNRLFRHGVTVTTIKPGFVDTPNLANAAKTFWVISPEEAAAQIYLAIRRKRGTVYIPSRWGLVGLIIRHIPSSIFRWLRF